MDRTSLIKDSTVSLPTAKMFLWIYELADLLPQRRIAMSLPMVLMRGIRAVFQGKTRHYYKLFSARAPSTAYTDPLRTSCFAMNHRWLMFRFSEQNGSRLCGYAIAICFLSVSFLWAESPQDQPDNALEKRLRADVTWLAAPEREGRGPGTKGIRDASTWISRQFDAIGLDSIDGVREQSFVMTLEATLPKKQANHAEIVKVAEDGRQEVSLPLKLGETFTPLAVGGSGVFDLPLVFAGYGITAPKQEYDDYEPLGKSAASKAVIVLRQEPQKENPHSVFNGNQATQHAALVRKIANASEHEAGAVVFCNDASATEPDALMDFRRAGGGENGRSMPVLQVSRSVVADVIKRATGVPVATLEAEIDRTLEPKSQVLAGWRIKGEVTIQRQQTDAENIVGVIPGVGFADGEIGGPDVVVLGAHYDHLGYGDSNSLAPGTRAIHHGADDNASGTATLLEVARQLQAEGPFPRTIVFIAFAGEERGLLGSGYYAANPLLPLKRTAAMVNLDMVGRLVDDKVIVHGTGTGTGFDTLVDTFTSQAGFGVAKEPGGFGPSDHSSFYARKIPVLHLFTGSHTDYHRPTDTADKVNYAGMARISLLVANVVRELATAIEPPAYLEVASKPFMGGGGDRPYFGSIPDFAKPGGGYAITGVSKKSPAAEAGLEGGDVIVRLGESAIAGLEDFDSALRKHKAGETVPVVVRRDGRDVTLQVTLGDPR